MSADLEPSPVPRWWLWAGALYAARVGFLIVEIATGHAGNRAFAEGLAAGSKRTHAAYEREYADAMATAELVAECSRPHHFGGDSCNGWPRPDCPGYVEAFTAPQSD